ncbi:DUF2637 domain-containing protein [Mycobacteroides chelonae]|uniref:DUF2637 domain-containing protein n=1 Tax=Mycobacteroides chelonae TaxID=1774 RepID=UPI00190FF7EC|nr:DUF2637 domain-containing protein [Mycobacteroides chelonae]QQG95883.1 DUF2637 domain-containing protein [Mycobacteroides chelonae]
MKITPQKVFAAFGVGHAAPAARAWTLLLTAAVATSVYGNTAHSQLTGHGMAAAAWHGVAPVALFWVTHLVGKTAARASVAAARWVVWLLGIPVSLAVSGMAFVVSFRALREWTLHEGGDELAATLLPLIIDMVIALSSIMVLALRERPAAEAKAARPSFPQRVRTWWRGTPGDAEQAVQTAANRDAEYADAPEYPGGLTWLAPVHHLTETTPEQPVHQAAAAAPEPVEQAGAPTVTSDDEAMHHPAAPVHQESETQPVHTAERHLVAVHRGEAPAQSQAVQAQSQPVRQRTAPEPEQAPEVQPVHLEQAAAVVQAGASELPVPRIAEVFARKDRGESQNTIAKAVPVNKRTVSKILAAREGLDTTTAEEPEPAFA